MFGNLFLPVDCKLAIMSINPKTNALNVPLHCQTSPSTAYKRKNIKITFVSLKKESQKPRLPHQLPCVVSHPHRVLRGHKVVGPLGERGPVDGQHVEVPSLQEGRRVAGAEGLVHGEAVHDHERALGRVEAGRKIMQ